jgi:hypothetical protein
MWFAHVWSLEFDILNAIKLIPGCIFSFCKFFFWSALEPFFEGLYFRRFNQRKQPVFSELPAKVLNISRQTQFTQSCTFQIMPVKLRVKSVLNNLVSCKTDVSESIVWNNYVPTSNYSTDKKGKTFTH